MAKDQPEGPEVDATTLSTLRLRVDEIENEKPNLNDAEFPDGGFRAWLVVAGVCSSL